MLKSFFQISLWIIIITLTAVVYDFRNEIIHYKYFSTFFPHAGYLENDGGVVFHKSRNGHFLIMAKVNNIPVTFLLDTGASDVLLSEEDSKKVRIDYSKPTGYRKYDTANGRVKLAVYKVDRIEVANSFYMDNVSVTIGANTETSLLGMNFLKNFKFSFSGEVMTIYPANKNEQVLYE